jgi:hypothetical protein
MKKFIAAILLSLAVLIPNVAEAAALNIFGDGTNDIAARRAAITIALNAGYPYRVSDWTCYYMTSPYMGPFVRCEAIFSTYVP